MIRFVSINNVIGGLEVGLVRRDMNQRLISEIQGEDRKVPKPGGCREEGWIRERDRVVGCDDSRKEVAF